jgi:hypothetical protein
MPKKTVNQIERPKRSSRERHGPEEARLLQRAITEKSDNSSAAVSRIIGAKAKEHTSEADSPKSGTPDPEMKHPEPVDELPEPEVKEVPAKTEHQEADIDKAVEDNISDTETPGMLFDEANITSPVQRTKAKKNDAVLTAAVFIGIGTKPYLRGSGGGLSWEKGLPMEFQEIGKWRWVAPSDLDNAIEVHIYRNDEDPDKAGKYTVEPGQKLEVSPVF